MGDIKEEDWNLPECKYECEVYQKCFCIIPCYGSITNVSSFVYTISVACYCKFTFVYILISSYSTAVVCNSYIKQQKWKI